VVANYANSTTEIVSLEDAVPTKAQLRNMRASSTTIAALERRIRSRITPELPRRMARLSSSTPRLSALSDDADMTSLEEGLEETGSPVLSTASVSPRVAPRISPRGERLSDTLDDAAVSNRSGPDFGYPDSRTEGFDDGESRGDALLFYQQYAAFRSTSITRNNYPFSAVGSSSGRARETSFLGSTASVSRRSTSDPAGASRPSDPVLMRSTEPSGGATAGLVRDSALIRDNSHRFARNYSGQMGSARSGVPVHDLDERIAGLLDANLRRSASGLSDHGLEE